ncbi:MAG: 1-deoxy-D-xylulose-5-phosphate reductoisomerase [Verrucomicrobiia bacterium]
MKRVILLGASGSIGQSTCKVARALPDELRLVGLAVGSNLDALAELAAEFRPAAVAVSDAQRAPQLNGRLPGNIPCFAGPDGLVRLVEETEADLVLVAIVGTAGLRPALAALHSGKDLAVASKEILVMAGQEVMSTARRLGRAVLPVDSEHNAIFQCLQGAQATEIEKLILTASGGPFRQTPVAELEQVTVAQALKHPTWSMGKKITIDSATLFNKGLEMIEARWLFDVPMDRVDVVVHPQSLVHSLVQFVDGSLLAQLSHSDMCFPIQYAITYPRRLPSGLKPLDLGTLGQLRFEPPDPAKFPALTLARRAGTEGGTLPAVFNAANEIAVDHFLQGRGRFPDIWRTVQTVMDSHHTIASPDLPAILEADRWAREQAQTLCRA